MGNVKRKNGSHVQSNVTTAEFASNLTEKICLFTARKTIFSFSRRSEKMVFPKKLSWNMIFLVLSGKMIFLFPENMILHVRRKMKDDLS